MVGPATDTAVGRYPVAGCEHNHGMALEPDGRRLFLLCGGCRPFTVFDLDAHRSIAHFILPAGAYVVEFDPGLGRAYASCSSGAITADQEDGPDCPRKPEDFPIQSSVHASPLILSPIGSIHRKNWRNGKPWRAWSSMRRLPGTAIEI